ncbi:hypothetical protein [Mycobacterium marinum]|nr:hypothetical protein [Mycobacterium marinum]MDC8984751.1 hypothetical protein [Mycobacterium marinum]MDC9002003.1 hypothetical protein [Mycobacterium marinum]MDC9012776.1 hypothetical protein [Mycobacterium marinum]MDC9018304.1 hypothetical protein [Mycobacterium marinum]
MAHPVASSDAFLMLPGWAGCGFDGNALVGGCVRGRDFGGFG